MSLYMLGIGVSVGTAPNDRRRIWTRSASTSTAFSMVAAVRAMPPDRSNPASRTSSALSCMYQSDRYSDRTRSRSAVMIASAFSVGVPSTGATSRARSYAAECLPFIQSSANSA